MLWLWILLGIIILILIIGLIIILIPRGERITVDNKQVPPPTDDNIPYRIVGDRDGSWWEVTDRGGNVLVSMGDRQDDPNVDITCDDGYISMIGINTSDDGIISIGPIYCQTDTGINIIREDWMIEPPDIIYGLASPDSTSCPDGYRIDDMNREEGIHFVCVPDIECVLQSNCQDNEVCNQGKCVPIANF